MQLPANACSRCLAAVAPSARARFCPRCGLPVFLVGGADPRLAADLPAEVTVDGRSYRVLDRIAVGSRCAVYRCRFGVGGEGTFKIVRHPVSNTALAREAEALRHLHRADPAGTFTPFVPAVVESFGYVARPGDAPRHANVLRLHPLVHSPADDLYSLAEVRAAYPFGLDGRQMAWVWRRLLTVLDFAHRSGVAHGAVLPVHVLVDPGDHKLVLIDWTGAFTQTGGLAPTAPDVPPAYRSWPGLRDFPSRVDDLRVAARSMADLLGGDGEHFPPAVDAALARHLSRCMAMTGHTYAPAAQLRDEFDRLIEALWGPRKFIPLTMPPKRHSV
jgi:hypothetical protein